MRVLVTGANGYIGQSVLKELVRKSNAEILANDFNFEKKDERIIYIEKDILSNPELIQDYLPIDCLIHLAWKDGFVQNSLNHIRMLSAHFNFIEYLISKGCYNINVMGTMHEVGYHEGMINEYTICNPVSLYGKSKYILRNAIEELKKTNEFNYKWLRAYYILGNDLKSNSVFGKLYRAAQEGRTEFQLTTGLNKFDFIEIDNLANQIICASLQIEETGVIEVCSGEPISLKDQIYRFIDKHSLNINPVFGFYPERKDESPCIYGDSTKINKVLNK